MPYSLPRWSRRRLRAGVNYWPRHASAGVAAFSPLSLSPALWLKADAGTLQTSGGSAATADGDQVGQLLDQSGNARHASQAFASKRPTLKLAIKNSLPVIRLDRVDDYLQAAFTLIQPCYVAMVAIYNNAGTAGNDTLFDGAVSNNTMRVYRDVGAPTHLNCYAGSNGPSLTTTPAAWHLLEVLFDGASSYISADGGTDSTGTNSITAIGGITLGANGVGTEPGGVDIGEVVVLSSAPSAPNRASLRSYLNGRWAIY